MSRQLVPPLLVAAFIAAALIAPDTSSARSEKANHQDAKNRYELRVPAGWQARTTKHSTEREKLLAGWRGRNGQAMAITRVDVRTPLARRGKRVFFDAIENSIKEKRPGYRRLYRKKRRVRRVRTLDLVFQHGEGKTREMVAMRMLFFSRYTLMLAVSLPPERWRRQRRKTLALLRSFAPHFARKR